MVKANSQEFKALSPRSNSPRSAPSKQWLELSVRASSEAVDAVGEVFRSHGGSGVVVEPPIAPHPDEGYAATGTSSRVITYLARNGQLDQKARAIEEALWHLTAFDLAPVSELTRRFIDEEDWANAWKEHFHPLRIGERFVVKPAWREIDPQPSDVVITLDPGMAFGTGLHPTTRMMMEMMEEIVFDGRRVLDVGTGSGILAIAAARLGALEVVAVDVDETACRAAAENARLNDVQSTVHVRQGSAQMGEGQYDVILANIIATVVAGLAPTFRRLMKPGSVVVASGIIEERAQLVDAAFRRAELAIVDVRRSGDWSCRVARLA